MRKAMITNIIAIIITLLIVGSIFCGLIWLIVDESKHLEKHLNSCQITCKKLGYKYIKLNQGGFGSPSCWCLIEKKPVRVW